MGLRAIPALNSDESAEIPSSLQAHLDSAEMKDMQLGKKQDRRLKLPARDSAHSLLRSLVERGRGDWPLRRVILT